MNQNINISRDECLFCADIREHHLPSCPAMIKTIYYENKNHQMPQFLDILGVINYRIRDKLK